MSVLARYKVPAATVWQPFSPLFGLSNELDRLFESTEQDFGFAASALRAWSPAVDVFSTTDSLSVKAELPGFKREDIEVSLDDGVLTISGERKFEKNHDVTRGHRMERFMGSFSRSITLPSAVKSDKVEAQYKDGVLTITLPKAEEAKRKQIAIKVN